MTRRTARRSALTVLLLAIVAAWVGLAWQARRRRDHLTELRHEAGRWGCDVYVHAMQDSPYEPLRHWLGRDQVNSIVGPEGYSLYADGKPATREQLAQLHEFRPLRSGWFIDEANVDDAWIEGIRDPWAVRDLNLWRTGVTDRCLPKLLTMRDLRHMTVTDTAISDDAVYSLLKLPRLGHLTIGGPNSRAIRLVDFEPGFHEGRKPRVRFRLAVDPRLGVPSNVEVFGHHHTSGWSILRRRLNRRDESPGVYAYELDAPGLPVGKTYFWRIEVQTFPPGGSPVVHRTFQSEADVAEPGEDVRPEKP